MATFYQLVQHASQRKMDMGVQVCGTRVSKVV